MNETKKEKKRKEKKRTMYSRLVDV